MAKRSRWPSSTSDLHELLRAGLDWIDVLLLVGTAGVLYVLFVRVSPILGASRLFALLAFAPVIARRALFGAPDRGFMRTGALWSLLGIVGLLTLLLGAGATSVGIWGLGKIATTTEPDWASEIRAEHEHAIKVTLVLPGESPEARAEREKVADEAAVAEEVPRRHAEWVRQQSHAKSIAWSIAAVGLASMALGALLDRVRFRKAPAST